MMGKDGVLQSIMWSLLLRGQNRSRRPTLTRVILVTVVTLVKSLHCMLAAAQCIVIGPVCGFVGLLP